MEVRNILTQGWHNESPPNKFYSKGGNDMDTAKMHELKTDPEAYDAIVEGHKTHTVRKDDRTYVEGDYIVFRKTKYTGEQMARRDTPEGGKPDSIHDAGYPLVYMGVSVLCKIMHVHEGPGMAEGYVVCSLKILDRYPGRVG